MPPFLAIVLGVCSIGALVALSSPFVMLYMRPVDAHRRARARRHAAFSTFVIACTVAFMLHLSLAGHAANVVVVIAVVVCMGALALFAFSIQPVWLAVSAGLLAGCAWLIGLAGAAAAILVDDRPITAQLSSSLYCRQTEYGSLGDAGLMTEIFRRHLFVDHMIYLQDESFVHPNESVPAPPGLPDAPARCHAVLDAQRRAAYGG